MCTNIKTSIDSLLVELCNQLSQYNNQGLQEQVCNPHHNRNSAILQNDLAEPEQACSTNIMGLNSNNNKTNTNHSDIDFDSVHKIQSRIKRKAPLASRGDFDAGQKSSDRESIAVKKEAVQNYSSISDDQQYDDDDNAHVQVQPLDDQNQIESINISLKKEQTRPHIKENESLNMDTHYNLIDQTGQKDNNQDVSEFFNKFERYDFYPYRNNSQENKDLMKVQQESKKDNIKNKQKEYQEANKDQIRLKNKLYKEANKDKIRNRNQVYKEVNKDKIRKNQKIYKDANKDKIKEYRESNKDKIKEYRESNKDKMKEYQESNKDKIRNKKKEYQESNKDKIRNKMKEYREKKFFKN